MAQEHSVATYCYIINIIIIIIIVVVVVAAAASAAVDLH